MKKRSSGQGMWKYVVTGIVCVIVATAAIVIVTQVLKADAKNNKYAGSLYSNGPENLYSTASYDEVFDILQSHIISSKSNNFFYKTMPITEDSAVALDGNVSTEPEYSDTNIRTENVLESDVVKTDGRYIYTISADTESLEIIDTKDTMKTVYSEEITDTSYDGIKEMFINGTNLHVFIVGSAYRDDYLIDTTYMRTYDISDPSNPVETAEYEQDGTYVSSRIKDGTIYLITNYAPSYGELSNDLPYEPCFNNNMADAADIYFGRNISSINYYCMSAIDLENPGEDVSHIALLNDSCSFYASDDSFFFTSQEWIDDKDISYERTNIMGFSYSSGEIKSGLTNFVTGTLNDSFAIDENNGYLRMVLHVEEYEYDTAESSFFSRLLGLDNTYPYESSDYNTLAIMDESLETISLIDGIADNEEIQSSRFYNDTLYFVTYQNTDPLFAVDLSDPYNPEITDGIKISGFSNYLHFWSDNLLLGIGYETDEDTGLTQGIKASMFDISDPTNLKEVDRFVVSCSPSAIATDFGYKQVLVAPEKNLIGFSVETFVDATQSGDYYILEYDKETGFNQLACENVYTYEDDYIVLDDSEDVETETAYDSDSETSAAYESDSSEDMTVGLESSEENTTASSDSSDNKGTTADSDSNDKESVTSETTSAAGDKTESSEASISEDGNSSEEQTSSSSEVQTMPAYEGTDSGNSSATSKRTFDTVVIPTNLEAYYDLITIQYVRGLYIDDYFYIVHPGNAVKKVSLKDYKTVEMLTLFDEN